MALLFPGKTICPLCQKVIGKEDEVFGTTAFIADQTDPLWQFSDAAFHKRCFEAWDRRAEFDARYEEFCRKHGRLI